MRKKSIINILLFLIALALVIFGYYINNPDYSQISYVFAVVIGFWAIMRIFKIKQIATKD